MKRPSRGIFTCERCGKDFESDKRGHPKYCWTCKPIMKRGQLYAAAKRVFTQGGQK